MDIDDRELDYLIKVQKEEDREYRKLENKSRQSAKRNDESPHGYGIAYKTELRIAARAEDARDDYTVHGSADHVIDAHDEHPEKILGSFAAQVNDIEYHR